LNVFVGHSFLLHEIHEVLWTGDVLQGLLGLAELVAAVSKILLPAARQPAASVGHQVVCGWPTSHVVLKTSEDNQCGGFMRHPATACNGMQRHATACNGNISTPVKNIRGTL